MTISPRTVRKCWEPDFQLSLREIAGDTYPQADYELGGDDPRVVFGKVWLGHELLKRSKAYDQRKPSFSEVARVQAQIEQLHAVANDPNVPADRREFFRNFRIPDPKAMPECWRTTGFLRKRLHILWGMEKVGVESTFLPSSMASGEWDDRKNRRSIEDVAGVSSVPVCSRTGCLGTILRWLVGLLLILLIVSLFRGCLPGCANNSVPSNPPSFSGGGKDESGNTSTPSPSTPPGTTPTMPPASSSTPRESGRADVPPSAADVPSPAADGDGTPSLPGSEMATPEKKDNPKEVSGLESAKALAFDFRVNPPKEISSSDEIAKVEFSVSPIVDLQGRDYVISDWSVNGEVQKPGTSKTFAPSEGLRYDKTYTISASVTVDGKPQRVEPFQWNMVDEPTWQIFESERDPSGERRRYKIICCNSSSVAPTVKSWNVAFRPGGKNEGKRLDFEYDENVLGKDGLELDWGIGRYKGAYYLELTAEVAYSLRGKAKTATHVETFPFSHDSSADALTKAKYEVVIPNVYFCLARLSDGSLINGTAFAISERRLLSNYHVAVGGIPECYANSGDYKVAGPLTLTNIKGKTYHAKVEWSDRGRDLAVLRLCDGQGNDTDDRLPGYLHLAEDSLVSGIRESSARHVFAIGYPKGTVCKGPPAFTDGKAEQVISRDYNWNGCAQAFDTIVNYTSTKCGYSGGPLVDYQTESVLGVNFGGLVEQLEGHKAASLATSVLEVRRAFPKLDVR